MKAIAIIAMLAVLGTALAQNESMEENVTARYGFKPPPIKKHYCSYYADKYDVVKLWGIDKKCYIIYDSGKYAKLGYVCVSIVTYHGKTCIAFKFYAAKGYKFTGLYAGASANCRTPTRNPYYVQASHYYPGKTLYVCLDTFYAYGPSGCCNTDICLYFKVTAKKYICKYVYGRLSKKVASRLSGGHKRKYYKCFYDHKTYWGFPSYQVCPKKSFYSTCPAPLKCYNTRGY